MKPFILILPALLFLANANRLHALSPVEAPASPDAAKIVEQMRGISMQPAIPLSNVKIANTERQAIFDQLRKIGKTAVPALAHALKDKDMQMRSNAALVLLELAGGYDGGPKMDIRQAMRALIRATGDFDSNVRAWSAQALGEIGPDAKEAVPVLIKLVGDPSEGSRNSGCIALGKIGPAAKDALPALQKALNDPSKDVRQFAKSAIGKIQAK